MQTRIDHLVIGAHDLRQGVDHIKACLGVEMPYGGVHEKMGTHNHLMLLGEQVFLEVIAVNPDSHPPERPRWYGLDDPFVQRRIREQPALLGWVVNTQDIRHFLQHAAFSFGKATSLRRGELNWNFGLPDDGRLLAGGMLPYVIQWRTAFHPATRMADLGCRLLGLEIHHPYPFWLQSILESVTADDLVEIAALPADCAPYMVARIQTPQGVRELHSDAGP